MSVQSNSLVFSTDIISFTVVKELASFVLSERSVAFQNLQHIVILRRPILSRKKSLGVSFKLSWSYAIANALAGSKS